MKTATLSVMRQQVREAADMVGSDFVTTTEIDALLNTYIAEVWDLIVGAYGTQKASSFTFNTVAGTKTYALPAESASGGDFYKLLGIDVTLDVDNKITAEPFNFHNRNRYCYDGWDQGRPIAYRLVGDSIWFDPTPDAIYPVVVWYIPCAAKLVTANQTFDGINGWERYPIVCAAIRLLDKEGSDCSVLLAEKGSLSRRIEAMAQNRDAGEPEQVVDVRGRRWGY